MQLFDIFVLPSEREGLSLVLIEATAASLPIVATDVGGNSEIVIDGVTGYLVPKENAEVLADKILRLLKNSDEAVSFGLKGHERVNRLFSLEAMVNNYLNLYLEGLNQ